MSKFGQKGNVNTSRLIFTVRIALVPQHPHGVTGETLFSAFELNEGHSRKMPGLGFGDRSFLRKQHIFKERSPIVSGIRGKFESNQVH